MTHFRPKKAHFKNRPFPSKNQPFSESSLFQKKSRSQERVLLIKMLDFFSSIFTTKIVHSLRTTFLLVNQIFSFEMTFSFHFHFSITVLLFSFIYLSYLFYFIIYMLIFFCNIYFFHPRFAQADGRSKYLVFFKKIVSFFIIFSQISNQIQIKFVCTVFVVMAKISK